MHRIDPVICAIKAKQQQLPPTSSNVGGTIAAAAHQVPGQADGGYDGCASAAVMATRGEAVIKERERALLPVYQQVRCGVD